MKPQVSIILATYNRAHFIVETLQSIQNQTYQNWECLIIDDGGTDNTLEVIAPILAQDKRFTYLKRTESNKKGLPGCRNYGLDLAKGAYIQFFDDDDIMHPQKLELQMEPLLLENNLDFTICKYRHYYGDENLNFDLEDEDCKITSNNLFEDFYLGKMGLNSLGPLWRSQFILKYRFDEDLFYAEERDLYLKLFLKEKPTFKNIDFVLFYYRKHTLSNTNSRYPSNIIKASLYKVDLNLYYFIKEDNLWNYFLLKEMIKKFVFLYFDENIYKELIGVIDKNQLNLGFKRKILKLILLFFIAFRKNIGIIINKL